MEVWLLTVAIYAFVHLRSCIGRRHIYKLRGRGRLDRRPSGDASMPNGPLGRLLLAARLHVGGGGDEDGHECEEEEGDAHRS